MSQIHELSATGLAAEIRNRTVSSREALDHLLERVDRLDGPINSVVTLGIDRAREEADAADRALLGGADLGPLHGVPMSVKDSFATEGMRTTSGAPELSGHVPDEDAWPVAAMRRGGAIVYGKTNLPIYAGDLQTYNEVFGVTNNPYDRTRTPGGSSGGSGAALAARFTPLEIGSDIGGSIRLPAHMSGVLGHKPSYGIVPAHGQIPGPPGSLTLADLAVAGPMARTIEDLRVGLDLMAGPNRWDGPAWRLELPPSRQTEIGEFRIATWFDDESYPIVAVSKRLLESAAAALADGGARLDPDARPAFTLDKAVDTFSTLLQAALSGGHRVEQLDEWAQLGGEDPIDDLRRRRSIRHRQWLGANERRLQMRKRFEEFFEDWDVLLLPVMPTPAITHDHTEPQAARSAQLDGRDVPYLDLTAWMAPAGVCWLPATVVPIGMTEAGLPVGVQIVAPFLSDLTSLRLGEILVEFLGELPTPSGFE